MSKKDNNKLNFTFRITKNGKTIQKFQSSSKQHFYKRARKISWKNKPLKVHLRVSYGKYKDVRGKYIKYDNSGIYETSKDFWLALRAFSENG